MHHTGSKSQACITQACRCCHCAYLQEGAGNHGDPWGKEVHVIAGMTAAWQRMQTQGPRWQNSTCNVLGITAAGQYIQPQRQGRTSNHKDHCGGAVHAIPGITVAGQYTHSDREHSCDCSLVHQWDHKVPFRTPLRGLPLKILLMQGSLLGGDMLAHMYIFEGVFMYLYLYL